MFRLSDRHKKKLRHHGEQVSQKLTDLTRESHYRKVIFHTRKEEQVMKLPLLLLVIVTLIFPLFVTLGILIFFLYGGNIVVEREE